MICPSQNRPDEVHPWRRRNSKPIDNPMYAWQKQKFAFKYNLIGRNDGSWGRFVGMRRRLTNMGMSPREAWRIGMSIYNEQAEDDREHLKFEATVFHGKTSLKEADVAWVSSVMGQKDVNPEQAPSATAYSLYLWATSNEARMNSFWERIFPKTMPNQQQVNQQSRTRGSDSKLQDLIQRAKARCAEDAD